MNRSHRIKPDLFSPNEMNTKTVLIVGAGMSGVTCGLRLQSMGHDVLLLDKGRSLGGRMATRRISSSLSGPEATDEPSLADHGAQFFTASSPEFRRAVAVWQRNAWVDVWCDGFLPHPSVDGRPRHIASGGMNALVKQMAVNLDVQVNERVSSLHCKAGRWQIETESAASHQADAVVLTSPVPQSLDLLQGVKLRDPDQQALRRIAYDPCVCLLIDLSESPAFVEGAGPLPPLLSMPPLPPLPQPGGLQVKASPLDWIADNQNKGISPRSVLTVHADAAFSQEHYTAEDQVVRDALLPAVADALNGSRSGLSAELKGTDAAQTLQALENLSEEQVQVKRWKFSKPNTLHPDRCLLADTELPLVFAGDAFGGAKVEGAFLSGEAAALALQSAFSS